MTDSTTPSPGPGAPHLSLSEALVKLSQRAAVVVAAHHGPGRPPKSCPLMAAGAAAGVLGRAEFERARKAGLVEQIPDTSAWRLSHKGREAVRRMRSGAAAMAGERASATAPASNVEESPLGWLKRRRGKDGASLITEQQFAAGERLRADFWFAQMTPRVTASWDGALGAAAGSRRGVPGTGVEMADSVVAAGERVRRALHAVGPELSGILVDVCCHLKGLEDLERSIGWPQRSGKVVLQLALTRLARHYGLPAGGGGGTQPDSRVRHWGSEDFRPAVDGGTGADQADVA